MKKVKRAPGQALTDFSIFKLVAEAWGCADMFERWSSPEAVFAILKELSRGQPCDFSGVEGYAQIDGAGGVQWPLREGEAVQAQAERRLFEDGRFYHPDGRARFLFGEPRPVPEPTNTAPSLAPAISLTPSPSTSRTTTVARWSQSW